MTPVPDLPSTSWSPTNTLNPPGSFRRHLVPAHPRSGCWSPGPQCPKAAKHTEVRSRNLPFSPKGAFPKCQLRNELKLPLVSEPALACRSPEGTKKENCVNYPSLWERAAPSSPGLHRFHTWGGAGTGLGGSQSGWEASLGAM